MSLFDELYDETNRFSSPYNKDDISQPYTTKMIKDCLNKIAQEIGSKINKNCRIYRDGRQLGPFEAKDFVVTLSHYQSLEMIDWKDVTDSKSFLIFVNYAAFLSNDLNEASRRLIGDFGTRFEPEGVSIEHHLIIGTYEETPFGVHIDDATDRVFHFNLGPEPKKMILWPRKQFLNTYRGDTARPLNSVSMKNSIAHTMKVGGCFFLPADYYHVGSSPYGVSAVISLAFTRQNHQLQVKSVLNALNLFANIKESADDYYKHFESRPDQNAFSQFWSIASHFGFEKLLEHARARNRSNNYFVEVLPLDFSALPSVPTAFGITDQSNLQMIEDLNTLHVYSRGHYASLSAPKHIRQFKAAIDGSTFDFCQQQFRDAMKEDSQGIVLLGWVIATKGAVRL